MAQIVNLNQARKARAKVDAARAAETNRVKYGRTKAERVAEAGEQTRRDALLDGAKRED